tara:strand:+ start:1927 stop:2490 length:564 start_codon:yes stop_codon:yes gene_type:complete
MWAIVTDNSIKEIIKNPKPLVIGTVQYPKNIFGQWTVNQLKSVGIYPVTIDTTNYKDSEWYTNTEVTYAIDGTEVKGTYGTATAKVLTDVLYTADDETDGLGKEGDIKTAGLKTEYKRRINANANSLLQETDWYALRAADGGTAVPSNIATYRAAIRTKANEHTTAIDNASDVDALAALTYDWPTAP